LKRFLFRKIDAFPTALCQGNPAGTICPEPDQEISDLEMQRIARELKGFINEVGSLRRLGGGSVALRFFSAEREVEFYGHAIVAILYDLLKNDAETGGKPSVSVVTPKGTQQVENRIAAEDAAYISAPAPVCSGKRIAAQAVADALDIPRGAIHGSRPINVVNAGLETLIVPMAGLAAVLAMNPSREKSSDFCREDGVHMIAVYTEDVADSANRFRTRVFAPTYGYLEDPATGSGNAALGYSPLRHGPRNGKGISVEQNGNRGRPNVARLPAAKSENGAWQAVFGGAAVFRIRGEYNLA
jgi:PhzF family phenazine biosynthesis protein